MAKKKSAVGQTASTVGTDLLTAIVSFFILRFLAKAAGGGE